MVIKTIYDHHESFIERSIYQESLEENKKRIDNNPEYYRLRQQITEHQIGTLKSLFLYFLGLKKVFLSFLSSFVLGRYNSIFSISKF